MSTITAPGPLVPLDAPLPQPRQFTLLDTVQIVSDSDERWRAGAWVNGYPAARPETHDPCASGTYGLKGSENTDARPMMGSFTVVVGGVCTARSIGPDPAWYKTTLQRWFEAVEAESVERVLVGGDGHFGTFGAYLGDTNMESLSVGAVTPTEGLALLESEIASVGSGVIHVAPATATYWFTNGSIVTGRDGLMRTGLGTPVVVGAGYLGARPDGEDAPAADEEWAFASDQIQIRRGEVTVLPGNYSEALDRSINEVTFYAERDYLLTFVGRQDGSDANHIQAGVLIDRLA